MWFFPTFALLEIYHVKFDDKQVKKHKHDALFFHSAGKHLPKGEASHVLRHLVTEDYLVEDVKKSDFYGSISSVLKFFFHKYFQ